MNNWCGHKKTLIGTEDCPLKHNFREEGVKFREFITNGGNLDDWCNRKTAEEASLRRELTPGGHIVTIRRKP